jgi:hypothetical protein
MMEKNWREAKIPKWVSESIDLELENYKRTAALSWPNEPKPEPEPFRWADYDCLTGTPSEGVFWGIEGFTNPRVVRIEVKKRTDKDKIYGYKPWLFKRSGSSEFTESVYRGPLFSYSRDAHLYALWVRCEVVADELSAMRSNL